MSDSKNDTSKGIQEEQANKSSVQLVQTKGEPKKDAAAADAKPKEEEQKKPKRSKEQLAASRAFVLGYPKRECCTLVLGFIWLVGGLVADLFIPLFIGQVVDYTREEKWDDIATLCYGMIGIVIVS